MDDLLDRSVIAVKWLLIIILLSEWTALPGAQRTAILDRMDAAIVGNGNRRETGIAYLDAASNEVRVICCPVGVLDIDRTEGKALRTALTNRLPSTVIRIEEHPASWMMAQGYQSKPRAP
jgi:hypothetical protein